MKISKLKSFIFLFFILINIIIVRAQMQPSMLYNAKQFQETTRGGTSYDLRYGLLPFSGKSQLRDVFNGREGDVSNALKELQYTSISLSVDTLNSNSIYVELLSFIPSASIGRLSFGSQINQSEVPYDTNGLVQTDALQNIARQKLMNGGGNFSLNLSRPLLFVPFTESSQIYMLSNASVTCYADIGKFNSTLYNPGLGSQFNIDFDLRLFSNKSEIMIGNYFRIGAKGRFMYNAFDAKYLKKYNIDNNLNNLAVFLVSGYIGIGPVFIELGTTRSNKSAFNSTGNILRFTLQPVKF